MTEPTARTRIVGADGLRALACLLVVGAHVFHHTDYEPANVLERLLARGGFGVNVFFVLSGFLLSLPFIKAYQNQTGLPNLKVYFLKRLARIVPGFYLCILVLLVCYQLYASKWDLFSVITTMTFTNSLLMGTYVPAWNGPLWSIGIEMQFYILLPLFALGLARCGGKLGVWWYGVVVLAMIFVGQYFWLQAAPSVEAAVGDPALFKADAWSVTRHAVILFPQFLCGFYAAYVFLRLSAGRAQAGTGGDGGSSGVVNFYDLLSVLAVVVIVGLRLGDSWLLNPVPTMDIGWPIIPISAAVLLCVLPFTKMVGPMLDNRFLCWTAALSYGIYLWHVPCIELLKHWWPGDLSTSRLSLVLFCGAVLVVSYAAAQLSYTFIEKPVLAWSNRYKPRPGKFADTSTSQMPARG